MLKLPGVARLLLRQPALGISDRVGTIEPGKLADLVLLDGDPVSDIEALGHADLVIKEGRIVYRRDPHARQIQ